MLESRRSAVNSMGLSLVELLVAIAIGVMLTFGAMTLLLHSNRSYLEAEELARMQENGRHALRYLSYELTMAGYLANLLPGTPVDTAMAGSACFDYLMHTARALEHLDNVSVRGEPETGGPALPADCLLSGRHQRGTDLLLIRRTSTVPATSGGVRRGSIEADSIYLARTGIFAAPELQRGGSQLSTAQEVWDYQPQVLFLRNYAASVGDGVPTLCRKRPGLSSNRMAPTQCLVEGIENLQLEFGIDETGDQLADRFEANPDLMEIRQAVAARIYLLVRSVRPVSGHVDDRSYLLGSQRVDPPGDKYYRRLMQTTVLLRNNGSFRS